MKVVLLHDWLTGFRGGERVLESFCEIFPDAPIYTLIHKKGSTSNIIESKEIITSTLDKVPSIHEHYRKFLPVMPLVADNIQIKHEADLILSSSHCVIKGVKKPLNSKHICYIHSPMRYIYDQFGAYFDHTSLPVKAVARSVRPYLQWWDKKSNANVDSFIANSNFVKERVNQYYQKDSKVIFPFVDIKDFKDVQFNPPSKERFFLMVTAFAPNKKVDLAIKAFTLLGSHYQLKIIGTGSFEETERLKKLAGHNVSFLGNLSRSEVIEHFSKAQALIFPGVEDFGITPLESLAAGTPVIAYEKAGVLDTLTHATADFFQSDDPQELARTIENFKPERFSLENLHARANLFSKENFKHNILTYIDSFF